MAHETTVSVLRATLTDQLAAQYSWFGAKGKLHFWTLQLASILHGELTCFAHLCEYYSCSFPRRCQCQQSPADDPEGVSRDRNGLAEARTETGWAEAEVRSLFFERRILSWLSLEFESHLKSPYFIILFASSPFSSLHHPWTAPALHPDWNPYLFPNDCFFTKPVFLTRDWNFWCVGS